MRLRCQRLRLDKIREKVWRESVDFHWKRARALRWQSEIHRESHNPLRSTGWTLAEPPLQSATHRPLNLYYTRWKSPATATPSERQHFGVKGRAILQPGLAIARFPRSCTWKSMHTLAACLSSRFRYRSVSHDRSVPFQPFLPLRASRYAACRVNTHPGIEAASSR